MTPSGQDVPNHRVTILLVLIGALLIHAPSLSMGFFFDDHAHQLVLDRTVSVEHMKPWNVYDFGYASDWQDVEGLLGNMPWWISPDFAIRFFRPLTSLSLRIDHALYGEFAVGYHITNLLLYLGILLSIFALYRALGLSRGVAVGALALFACSNGGWLTVAWIANRNSLLVLLASILALLALEKRARWGEGPALMVALFCGLMACLAKESGISTFAVIAWRLLFIWRRAEEARTRQWARAGGMGALALAGAYLIALVSAGYGVKSLLYSPPWTDPAGFLSNLGVLLTAGALELLAPVSIDTTQMLTGSFTTSVVLGSLFGLPVFVYIVLRLGRDTAVFLAGWALLFTIPQASGGPADRLLFCAAFGTAALLAMFIADVAAQKRAGTATGFDRTLALTLLIAAGPLSAIGVLGHSTVFSFVARDTNAAVLRTDVGDPSLGRRQLILMQTANPFLAGSLGPVWRRESSDLDLRFENVHASAHAFEWTREGDRVFTMRSLEDAFLTSSLEAVYMTERAGLRTGQRFESESFEVEIVELDPDGGLRMIRLRFDRSVDAPSLRFLVERNGRLASIRPPAIGEAKVVERAVPNQPSGG